MSLFFFFSRSWCNVSKTRGHHRDSYLSSALEIRLAAPWRASLRSGASIPSWFTGIQLTEHKQLFVRACERVHQQVPPFTGWKWRLQPHRPKEGNKSRGAGTIVSGMRWHAWRAGDDRRSQVKLGLLTSRPAVFFCVFPFGGFLWTPPPPKKSSVRV